MFPGFFKILIVTIITLYFTKFIMKIFEAKIFFKNGVEILFSEK